MKIGLFGGTFNPIHFGHLRTVREVQEGFDLDEVYLIPSALPPHKAPESVADAQDRLEMTRLAVSDCTDIRVSDVELRRSGPSYTIDTVRHFKSVISPETELFFILGIDAFLEIDYWKSYEALFRLIPFIVMARPGARGTSPTYLRTSWKILEDHLNTRISQKYEFSESRMGYIHPEKQPVHFFNVTLLDISATKIRGLIREGKTIQFLVPEQVEHFIKTKGLFL